MLLVGVKFNAVPLQMVVCNCVEVLVMTGAGLTVTVTSMKLPLQPFAVGVIRYVTLPLVIPSVEFSTWLIVPPLPALAPVTLLLPCIVQLKVVPVTPFGFVMDTDVLSPLQIVWLEAFTSGIGLTVTVTENGDPSQPLAEGII